MSGLTRVRVSFISGPTLDVRIRSNPLALIELDHPLYPSEYRYPLIRPQEAQLARLLVYT